MLTEKEQKPTQQRQWQWWWSSLSSLLDGNRELVTNDRASSANSTVRLNNVNLLLPEERDYLGNQIKENSQQPASYIFLVVICTCSSDKKILNRERSDIFADRDSGRRELRATSRKSILRNRRISIIKIY